MKQFTSILIATLMACSGAALADKTAGEHVDDSTLQAEVKARLAGDDFFGGMAINTEVYKGVVQLGGFVQKQEEADRAGEVAAAVAGVAEVDNQLHVRKGDRSLGQSVDDGVITTRVKSAIGNAKFGSALRINVDTWNGVVLLTGFVNDQADKDKAGEIAAGVANVDDVINGINVP